MYLCFANRDGMAEVDTDHDLTFDEIDTMLTRLSTIVIRTRATYDHLGLTVADGDDG